MMIIMSVAGTAYCTRLTIAVVVAAESERAAAAASGSTVRERIPFDRTSHEMLIRMSKIALR